MDMTENKWVTFVLPSGTCLCTDCFYGFHALKELDFEVFGKEGLILEDGMIISPALVSQYFQTCDRLFRKEFDLEVRTLEESCLLAIRSKSKEEHIELLPGLLKEKVQRARYISRVGIEWTIPSTLAKHFGLRVKLL